jgi:PIN like domain
LSAFFVDRCISPELIKITHLFDPGHEMICHDERFPQNTDDAVWIAAVATWTPKPIVLSGDGRILERKSQKQVLKGVDLTWVALASGWPNLSFKAQVIKFLGVWDHIVKETGRVKQPTVFKVPIACKQLISMGPTSDL